jgi:beta-N-acetylhexosaminidase
VSRRAILIAAGVLLLLGGGLAVALGGDDAPRERAASVPEGGSRLRGEAKPARERTLLGILSALLARSAPESADPPREAAAASGASPRDAGGLAARLPPSRLAAQVLLVGLEGQDAGDPLFKRLAKRDFGGVVLEERNYASAAQVTALAAQPARVAAAARHLPPLIAAAPRAFPDAAPPGARRLIASGDPERGRELARSSGKQLTAIGVDLVLGPNANVGVPGAAGEEDTLGDEPREVSRWVSAMVAGYRAAGVATAPGHFPGQGAAGQDPLEGPAGVGLPKQALAARDLRPFAAVARRTEAVVVSNASFAAYDAVTPAAMNPAIVRGLLRDRLRFRGVAIADNVLGASAGSALPVGEAAVAALVAGCDMVYVRDRREQEEAYAAILTALRRGELSQARLRQAVARVIELKRSQGLFATQ